MKGPVYNKGGKIEDATNVHTDIVSLDINGTSVDATIAIEASSNDLIIQNPMSDGDVRVKLGDTAGGGSFIVQDSADAILFKISSNGRHVFSRIKAMFKCSSVHDKVVFPPIRLINGRVQIMFYGGVRRPKVV